MKHNIYTALIVIGLILFYQGSCQNLKIDAELSQDLIQLAIIGSNDLHGTAFPKTIKRTDNGEQYTYGGLIYASSLIQIIQKQYEGRVLYLDAGDEFQGGIESSPQISSGQIMTDFFQRTNLDGAVLGNHQFDYSQQYLKNYLSKKSSPTIVANLQTQKNGNHIFDNQYPSRIFTVGGIKIGVIGLLTQQTKQGSSGFLEGKFPNYTFPDPAQVIIKQSDQLRKQQGAQIVLILCHIGNYCPRNDTFDLRTVETKQDQCSDDQLNKILNKVPAGTIDGVVGGHRHTFMHHYNKDGIPFMGAVNGGYYFNILHIIYNKKLNKIHKTAIQGPVPICARIFKNTKKCRYHKSQQLKTAGPLVHWKYHNVTVAADAELQSIFDRKWKKQMQKYFQPVFETEMVLERVVDAESDLANLITTMMARGASRVTNQSVHIAILNQGGFRSTWYPGQINLKQYYSMFSFADKLNRFYLTGKQLKLIQQIIQPGKRGFYYFYGVKQTLRRIQSKNQKGNTILKKSFVNATMMDGSQIIDDKIYAVVALDFLTGGGDDFIKVLKGYNNEETKLTYQPIQLRNLTSIGIGREIVLEQLKKLKIIKKSEWGVNLDNPWTKVINN